MRARIITAVAVSAWFAVPSLAAFVPTSASRSLQVPPPVTQSGFGVFNDSRFASVTGGGSQPVQIGVTVAQNSNIGDNSSVPMVSYSGSIVRTSTTGSPSGQQIPVQNIFTLAFNLTDVAIIQHTFPTQAPGVFSATVTPSVGTAINLLAAGSNGQALPAGSYTLSITGAATAALGINATDALSGTISFVPAPGGAGLLSIAALAAARRRRPSNG